jgi:glycerol kinase
VILAIDQGTTGTTCIVFDEGGRPVGRAYREFTQHFPRPGWVEHDAAEIWDVTQAVAGEALERAGNPSLAGIGITTSARRWWRGTAAPASRCTARSSGRTGAPLRAATS